LNDAGVRCIGAARVRITDDSGAVRATPNRPAR